MLTIINNAYIAYIAYIAKSLTQQCNNVTI